MEVIPYEYRKARFQFNLKGYWVRLYLIFDGQATYTFYHHSEMIENACLLDEISKGCCSTFTREILVTPRVHKNIFHVIEDYEQKRYVSSSDND